MTVSATGRVFAYPGDGTTVAFAFARNFYQISDLKVYSVSNATGVATLKSYATHYTVAGNRDTSGGTGFTSGTITMLSAPAIGTTLVIMGDADLVQNVDLSNTTNWNTASIEDGLDYVTLLLQEQRDALDRAVKAPKTRLGSFDPTLPAPIPGRALVINSTGDAFTLATPSMGAVDVVATAGASLSALRGVMMAAGTAIYCDAATPSHKGRCFGVSLTAAATAAQVAVRSSGLLEDAGFAFTPDQPVYLGPNGTLTQTSPASGFTQRLGHAVAATKLFLQIERAITLI